MRKDFYKVKGCFSGHIVTVSETPFLQGDNYIKLSAKIISYIYFTGRKRKLLLHLLRGSS